MLNLNADPIPEWTEWAPWSPCTVTCGGGLRQRARECANPTLRNSLGELVCDGDKMAEEQCNGEECPMWTEWEEWSKCTR